MPAVDLRLLVDVADGPVKRNEAGIAGSIRRHEPDIEAMPAESAVQRLHHGDIDIPMVAEPRVCRSDRKFVRCRIVAYLGALALPNQILQSCRDGLCVRVRVKVLRDCRHPPRNEVKRRARAPKRRVVVVGEAIHRLLGPVGIAGKEARERRRDFAKRLEHALVAELFRHHRRHRGL